jgi:signal peptidase I
MTLCVASQRVFIIVVVIVYFVTESVRKLLATPSYFTVQPFSTVESNSMMTTNDEFMTT